MASNRFGELFSITTWGESHGKAIGVVIDGCPAGVSLDEEVINAELKRRAPGKNRYTSSREEPDKGEILSGVFDGVTTGAPIAITIRNRDADPSKYGPIKDLLRPGHANYGYLSKYGVYDYRGGGRASARETACRVAAGAVAKQLLKRYHITFIAYLKQVGSISVDHIPEGEEKLKKVIDESVIFCPDVHAEAMMTKAITDVAKEGNSLGGMVEFQICGVPAGLGDPIYQKLDAKLALAMMGIPAAKGFEIGSGFSSVMMKGSEHNDAFMLKNDQICTKTNHAGGVLGGITTGMNIFGRVAFKPTASIMKPQETIDIHGSAAELRLPEGSRHDPCVAVRAVPVVEAMAALVVVDAFLRVNPHFSPILGKMDSNSREKTILT